jgi:hypothetical protein
MRGRKIVYKTGKGERGIVRVVNRIEREDK